MIRNSKQFRRLVIAALALVLALTFQPTEPLAKSNGNPGVIPPHAKPFGKSYGEWSAMWQKWLLSIPAPHNPNLDPTGADCGQGQSGKVWFLAGSFGGDVTRACTVPVGKALFFPIVNQEWDNFLCTVPDTDLTVDELRAFPRANIDRAMNLACEVDGVPIRDLTNVLTTRYRVESEVFSITLPDNNVYQAFCADALPGTYSPAVDDGVYLMLAPLPPGKHLIHFHAEIPDFGFTLDVTYRLTVATR